MGASLTMTCFTSSSRLDRGRAASSPLFPRARSKCAMVTSFRLGFRKLFQDLQREPPIQLHPCSSQQRSDRPGCAALLSDDLAQVGGSDSQLQHSDLLALHFADAHLVRYINKSFRNIFNELLHFQAASYSVALWPSILTGIFSRESRRVFVHAFAKTAL